MSNSDDEEVFELELWGGATERRYRSARPDIEAMPWGSLAESLRQGSFDRDVVEDARRQWTIAAFQEHRTGAQCAQALEALFVCKAPVDIVASFARFPLDEVAHVELAARMAMELGGAIEIVHTANDIVRPVDAPSPIVAAAVLVVRTFCVGEALSIPLLHAAWQDASHPLARAVLGRIVRDEAAHGIAGWTFLDWARPHLDDDDGMTHVARAANAAIGEVLALWKPIRERGSAKRNGLGWIGDAPYLELAENALATRVIKPLEERGVVVDRALRR